jgi:hypothetical protein
MRRIPVIPLLLLAACVPPKQLPFAMKASRPLPAPAEANSHEQAVLKAALERYYPKLAARSGVQTVFFVTTAKGTIERTDVVRGLPPVGATADALYWRFSELRDDPHLRSRGVTVFPPGVFGQDSIYVVWAERDVAPPNAKGPFRLSK